jgi:hypothetical protein
MTNGTAPRPAPGTPGVISFFFVVKAGLFAAAAWVWLLVLVAQGDEVTGWHLVATGAGICFSLVTVQLAIRYTSQRAEALRYADLRREIVDLSWHAAGLNPPDETSLKVLRMPPDRTRR